MIPSHAPSRVTRHRYGRCGPGRAAHGERVRQAVLDFIATCDYPPSLLEIGKAVGLSSSSSVWNHVRKLRKEGLIAPAEPGRSRAIVLANPGPSELDILRTRAEEAEELLRCERVLNARNGARVDQLIARVAELEAECERLRAEARP